MRAPDITDNSSSTTIKVKESCSNHAGTMFIDIRLLFPVGLKAAQRREIHVGMVMEQSTQNKGRTVGTLKARAGNSAKEIGLKQWQQNMAQSTVGSEALVDIVLTKRLIQSDAHLAWQRGLERAFEVVKGRRRDRRVAVVEAITVTVGQEPGWRWCHGQRLYSGNSGRGSKWNRCQQ